MSYRKCIASLFDDMKGLASQNTSGPRKATRGGIRCEGGSCACVRVGGWVHVGCSDSWACKGVVRASMVDMGALNDMAVLALVRFRSGGRGSSRDGAPGGRGRRGGFGGRGRRGRGR